MSPPNLSHLLSQHPILSSIVESLSTLDLHNLSLTNRTNHLYIHGTRNPINTYFASTQCAGQSSTRIRLSNMAKLGQLRGWIGSIIPPLAAKNPLCEGKSRFRCRKCHVPVCRSCAPRLSYVQRQDHNLENGTIDVLSRRYVLRLELPLAYAHGDHLSYARISDSESRIVKEHRRRHFCSSPSSCASSASTLSSQGGSTAATKPDQVLVHEQKPRRQPTHMCKCEDLNYHALGWNVFSKWELCWDCGTSIGEGDAKSRPKYGDKCFARGGKDKVTGRYKKGPTVGFKRYCSQPSCNKRVFQDDCVSVCSWCDGALDNSTLDFGTPALPSKSRSRSAVATTTATTSLSTSPTVDLPPTVKPTKRKRTKSISSAITAAFSTAIPSNDDSTSRTFLTGKRLRLSACSPVAVAVAAAVPTLSINSHHTASLETMVA